MRTIVTSVLCVLASLAVARCSDDTAPPTTFAARPTLRVGVSNAPQLATDLGVQQFFINQTNEGLLRVNQEGRVEPWLAESWARSPDGLKLSIQLRKPTVVFHDGRPADAPAIVGVLNGQLTGTLRQWAPDVESISANEDNQVVIAFKRASTFFIDALMDALIAKPGTPTIGVGAFKPSPPGRSDGAQVVAHDRYYGGLPSLGGLALKTYPNIRAAWADLLRNQLDMLYEVGADAIESMRGASNARLYTFDRPYQYVMFLNQRSPKLKSPDVRRALNQAIDRSALVRDALSGHGTPSVGPVSRHHWAFESGGSTFDYAPEAAAAHLPKGLTLTCYTLSGAPYEQLALVLKQQLRAVGVDLTIKEAGLEEVNSKQTSDDFEAVLLDAASGWSLSRVFQRWHSTGAANVAKFSNPNIDAALERINHAIADDEYRAAVAAFQKVIAADPPAVFLAWSDRSRAVSARFDVTPEPRRDILATLRTWHLSADNRNATH